MKTFLTVLVATLLHSTILAQPVTLKTDVESEGLRGTPQSVVIYNSRIDPFGNVPEKTIESNIEFDKRGRKVKCVSYRNGLQDLIESFFYKEEFVGRFYQYRTEEGVLIYHQRFDSLKRLTESVLVNAAGDFERRSLYRYDSLGNITLQSLYGPDESLQQRIIQFTDSIGLVGKKIVYSNSGNVQEVEWFQYDQFRRLSVILACSTDSKALSDPTVYSYNSKNDIVRIEMFRGNVMDQPWYVTEYDYEYDNFGNWTKRTTKISPRVEVSPKTFPILIEYRNVKYF